MIKKESYEAFLEGSEKLDIELATWMLAEIGSIEDEFREDIYAGWKLLLTTGRFPVAIRQYLLAEIFQQGLLFQGLEEEDQGNSVFTRSFTSLFLTLLLKEQRQNPWMTSAEEENIIQQATSYVQKETDNRGLVPKLGWAHAFAHGGDLLTEICLSQAFTKADVPKVLAGLTHALAEIEDFRWGEEERLLKAVMALFATKKITDEELASWFSQLAEQVGDVWNHCYSRFCMSAYFEMKARKFNAPMTEKRLTELLLSFYQKHQMF